MPSIQRKKRARGHCGISKKFRHCSSHGLLQVDAGFAAALKSFAMVISVNCKGAFSDNSVHAAYHHQEKKRK